MTTSVFEAVKSIDNRIAELRTLLESATDNKRNPPLYDALCRSVCVLIASHLEGFVKDLSRSAVNDLNFYRKEFAQMPPQLKRAFCEKILFFEGVEQRLIERRITMLHDFLERNSVAIDLEAFKAPENNKNAAISFIDATFDRLGTRSIVKSISNGFFDQMFEDSRHLQFLVLKETRRHRHIFYSYPYKSPPSKFNIVTRKEKSKDRTLWHDYIDAVLTRRHTVAHGDSMSNDTNDEQLYSDINKMSVFMHALAYGLAFSQN